MNTTASWAASAANAFGAAMNGRPVIAAIFDALGALRGLLPGMKTFQRGPNISPEGLSRGHTHGFTIDFEDAAARDAYLALPEHEAAGARLVKAAQGGLSGLTVLDFDLG